ncbi:MAG: biotin--[Neisseriaceae bacterium]|nr:biotin--[acetyl-CoA-carboxylase] ligase [Neisseriaceae bacterium]
MNQFDMTNNLNDCDANTLWSILSDGKPHNVADLCIELNTDAGGLNRLRLMLPENVRESLKQGDGFWQLRYPSVVFRQTDFVEFASTEEIYVEVLDECTSTNTVLSNRVRADSEARFCHAIVANHQLEGRGRQDRQWIAPAGDALTFSMALTCQRPQNHTGALPLVVALSCQKVLQRFGVIAHIKWPNDLMVGNAKLGGILIESIPQTMGHTCVIGVGLNFRAPLVHDQNTAGIWQYDDTIQPTSFLKALIHEINRDAQFFFIYGFSRFQTAYISACRDNNRIVVIMQKDKVVAEGRVLGVDGSGALMLEDSGNVKKIVNGEVSLRHKDELSDSSIEQILILDCGNSQIKWAWVINKEIVGTFRAPYSRISILGEFCRQHRNIKRVYGCAVCGQMKKLQVAENVLHRIEWLTSEQVACGIRNHYRHIGEHGADRWFNALGVRRFTNHACVVISCGTAITVDAVTSGNQYLGGSILPGFNLMKEALSQNTANLNRPFGRIYPFATTTPNAIASGIMDAVIGAILLMHGRLLEKEEGLPVDVILTGGGASRIYHHLPTKFITENHVELVENLVFFGLLNRIEQL